FFHKIFKPLLSIIANIKYSVSDEAADNLFLGKKYHIKPNGIAVKEYEYDNNVRVKYRKKLGLDNDKIVIGTIGRLNKVKNQSFLIEIFKEFKEVISDSILIIIGEGTELDSLKKRALE